MSAQQGTDTISRLDNLLSYLEDDPQNLTLLADAAAQALSEQKPEIGLDLLDRRAALSPPGAAERNLEGLARISAGDYAGATDVFRALRAQDGSDPTLKFNLAWALAMDRHADEALAQLDNAATSALPQAAMLHIQLLHDAGKFDEAADHARIFLKQHPDDPGLNAAISVLALDIEDKDLARASAKRGGEHPDALATLGTLALGEDRSIEALGQFDRAIALKQTVPRAWVGRGLAKLMTGDSASAPADIDRGAELFGDHLGSWIAAGWSYVVAGDLKLARERFDKALSLDPTFAESHGSLAALDAMEGRVRQAEQGARTALRLDRQCFSAALAKTLLANHDGNPAAAQQFLKSAINIPINAEGQTIAQSLVRMGLLAP